jgi:hypothetical protein
VFSNVSSCNTRSKSSIKKFDISPLEVDHDNGMLDISRGVFSLMELNINDNRLQHLTDEYCDRAYHVTEIAFNDNESFERLATEIFNWLVLERRKYKRLLSKS